MYDDYDLILMLRYRDLLKELSIFMTTEKQDSNLFAWLAIYIVEVWQGLDKSQDIR